RVYQLRGFFDRAGDFTPFFTVRRSTTPGDVIGGALADPTGATPGFAPIAFGSVEDYPKGQVVMGVVVTLALPVVTEPPLFQVEDSLLPLSAEAVLPYTADPVDFELGLFAQTNLQLS